jgi:hypothetical protein
MSKVERRKVPPEPVKTEVEIVVTLSEDEACELAGILGRGEGLVDHLYFRLGDGEGVLPWDWKDRDSYKRGEKAHLTKFHGS